MILKLGIKTYPKLIDLHVVLLFEHASSQSETVATGTVVVLASDNREPIATLV